MLETLRRPIPAWPLILGAWGAVVAVALYCIGYTALTGRSESPAEATAWAVANILPWVFAIEGAKRANRRWAAGMWLSGALSISIAIGYLLDVSADGLAFELVRRLPALALSLVAVALLRSSLGGAQASAEMPLLPRQIDWVRAAGNYIEIRAHNRTIVHRSSISAAEQSLARHGFVRIHRSTLVRRDRIARVRSADVVLEDGTHLKVGKRYRASLAV